MKSYKRFLLVVLSAICFFLLSVTQTGDACSGSTTSVCIVSQTACLKSMVLSKSVPRVVVKPPATSVSFNVQATLFITTPTRTNCGTACPGGGTSPVGGRLGVTLHPTPGAAPIANGMISTSAGTMAMPTSSAAGVFNPYLVPVMVPAATPTGCYTVVGNAVVPFSDGTTLTQIGDTLVCLVEPAPGQPTVPRLNMELLSPSLPRMAPGDQHVAMYRVTNNDPTFPVTLTGFGNSKQNALRPSGGNEFQGVFTISNPFGDDFPIMFNPGASCIPLPSHPYTQPQITQSLPPLGPGMSTTINVGIRSYGQCASGSCTESTFRVEGTFGDGSTAKACAGMALFSDTSMPTTGCGMGENDCNHNGIPDAVDIATNPSLDTNFNALPDTCENGLLRLQTPPLPKNVYVPIELVQLSLVSIGPAQVTNVWANGVPMSSPNGIDWTGQIPAAPTVGPQTIYFLGKDVQGRLATTIQTYRVGGNRLGDFDGDNKADIAVVRRTGGAMIWYILNSNGGTTFLQHGSDTDILAPGDYDGDRRSNIGVWRPSNGTFYPDTNPATNYGYFPFGTNGDKPIIGDYDGDGRTDFAVFRPSDRTFYSYDSLSNRVRTIPFGLGTDKPIAGDFDGDGRTDIAVWRETTGDFYWFNSVDNTFSGAHWGQSGDRPISGDFDGDGKTDLCIFRAGTWWIRFSSNGSFSGTAWGLASDVLAPADYDGDGKTDLAVYRNGIWHLLQSSNGSYVAYQWGISTDTPVPNAYQPN